MPFSATSHLHLANYNEQLAVRYRLRAQGYDFTSVVARVVQVLGIDQVQIMKPGKQPERVAARSRVCHWAVDVLKMNGTEVGRLSGMVRSAGQHDAGKGSHWRVASCCKAIRETHNFMPVPHVS